jgi:DNA (cytosine-5)-methyltransferase 1
MIIVDNFAGGGGASTGIEMAIGRPVDIAINHDPAAVAMHKVNHPNTLHTVNQFGILIPEKSCKVARLPCAGCLLIANISRKQREASR